METPERIRNTLAHAMGSENHWLVFPGNDSFKITDGVKVMAEICEAFWLVTDIMLCQTKQKLKKEPFQVWKLTLNPRNNTNGAVLIAENGNGVKLARQEIGYTDFPLSEGIKLFFDSGILMLPSEY